MAEKNINWWLMKSEPSVYSIQDLKDEGTTLWDGIRNYQARNFMREMQIGDQVFFYHSNCKPPCIVGLMEVSKVGLTDPTQFDINSKYYDPRSSDKNPRWDCAQLSYVGKFSQPLSLEELKSIYTSEELPIVRKGNRLSIVPVPAETAKAIINRVGKLI